MTNLEKSLFLTVASIYSKLITLKKKKSYYLMFNVFTFSCLLLSVSLLMLVCQHSAMWAEKWKMLLEASLLNPWPLFLLSTIYPPKQMPTIFPFFLIVYPLLPFEHLWCFCGRWEQFIAVANFFSPIRVFPLFWNLYYSVIHSIFFFKKTPTALFIYFYTPLNTTVLLILQRLPRRQQLVYLILKGGQASHKTQGQCMGFLMSF